MQRHTLLITTIAAIGICSLAHAEGLFDTLSNLKDIASNVINFQSNALADINDNTPGPMADSAQVNQAAKNAVFFADNGVAQEGIAVDKLALKNILPDSVGQ